MVKGAAWPGRAPVLRIPPGPGEEAAARLAMGTEALGGEGWGLIDSDTVDGSREIVALLGVGGQR